MTLALGTVRRGRELRLSDEERSRHIHVVGASGTGKSKLLESLIRQDMLRGRGLCLIDPHGTLADSIIEWSAALKLETHRRIHVVDLKDEQWVAGFNPLRLQPGQHLTARVDAMVETCAEVWGGEDINQTPLLTTCLQLVFYALARHGLTLLEAVELTASTDPLALRERLIGQLDDQVYESYWRELSALPRREFEERFSSTRRRLLRFLGSPVVRRMVGQRASVLDMRRIMDEGDVLIVNLVPRGAVSAENARLLGALITSELRLCALARTKAVAEARPFSLYIDECYDYLTGDVERMLDETRKFGLHVILAHQRLGQLRARSEAIYNGVMAGGQTKVVFGGMTDEDAEIMARHVFRSTFNLERPKRSLDKPIVVDEVPYWLESEGWTESESTTTTTAESSTWGHTTGAFEGLGEQYGADGGGPYGQTASTGSSSSDSESWGTSTSRSETSGSSSSRGRAQTLKPIRVTMPTAVHSLDEELHLAIVKLRELPNQAAIAKRPGRPPVRFRPTTVKPALVWTERATGFLTDSRAQSPYIVECAAAEAEIAARTAALGYPEHGQGADESVFFSE